MCGLESLECRRVHNDLIFLYKVLNGLVLVNFDNDLNTFRNVWPYVHLRGYMYKLEKQLFYLEIRKNFFTCRIFNV